MKWKGGAFTDQRNVRQDQTLGVSAVRDGELQRSHCAPWVSFPGSPRKLSYLTFYCLLGERSSSNSTLSLWELFWEDSLADKCLGLGPSTVGAGLNPWLENEHPEAKKKKRGPFFPGNPGGGRKRRTSQQEAVNLHEKYYVWFIVCQVNRWVVSATERGRETRSFWEDR